MYLFMHLLIDSIYSILTMIYLPSYMMAKIYMLLYAHVCIYTSMKVSQHGGTPNSFKSQ